MAAVTKSKAFLDTENYICMFIFSVTLAQWYSYCMQQAYS